MLFIFLAMLLTPPPPLIVHLRPLEKCPRRLDRGPWTVESTVLPGARSFIKDYAYNDVDNDDKQLNARPKRRLTIPVPQLSFILMIFSKISFVL